MQLYNHCERFMAELADRGLSDNFTQSQIWDGIFHGFLTKRLFITLRFMNKLLDF